MKERQQFIADLVERANRVWNNGDFMVFNDLYAPDLVCHHPGVGTLEGSQAMAEYIHDLRVQYPDLLFTIEETVFDGEKMVCHWRFKGTDMGMHAASQGPPTGKKVDFKGVDVLHFKDGKIVDDYIYFDQLEVLQQLGMVEPFFEQ